MRACPQPGNGSARRLWRASATVQRLAAAGMPLNLPAALARAAAQQQQHQMRASAAAGSAARPQGGIGAREPSD